MTSVDLLIRGLDALIRTPGDDFLELVAASGLDPATDFRRADLSGTDLRGLDLSAFDLRFARFTGARVDGARLGPEVTPLQLADATRTDLRTATRTPSILILQMGARAEQIARLIAAPDWHPAPRGSFVGRWDYEVRHAMSEREETSDRPQIFITRPNARLPRGRFDVVVVLADDGLLADFADTLDGAPTAAEAFWLLAPAPPRDTPSTTLVGSPERRTRFHAVIDTSIARSPFWSGNADRSFDRRVADSIVGAAMLTGAQPQIQEALSRLEKLMPTPLLTFALGPAARRDPSPGLVRALSSETTGLVTEVGGLVSMSSLLFEPVWPGPELKHAKVGIMEVRAPEVRGITEFLTATAVASPGVAVPPLALAEPAIPDELRGYLKFPAHAVGVSLVEAEEPRPLAVLAETPDLELVKFAAGLGWRVARYTDAQFVTEVAGPTAAAEPALVPSEVKLPPLHRRPENRGLATRGVDPRDVVRLPVDIAGELSALAPKVMARAMRFRPTFRREDDLETLTLIPTADLSAWLNSRPDAPRDLIRQLDAERRRKPGSPKRPSDLNVAWLSSGNLSRFVVADGPIPIRLDLLDAGQAPAQSMFIIDGDAAVPALLQSKLFEIWARATTTRSTSWMSRFSVSRTFETFPVLSPFLVDKGETRAALTWRPDTTDMQALGRQWLAKVEEAHSAADPAIALSDDLEAREIRHELDGAIQSAYGLPTHADDHQILARLLDLSSAS